MTEDQAKTKWCPFANSRSIDRSMGDNQRMATAWLPNEDDSESFTICCIGSECMAWRWKERSDFKNESSRKGTSYDNGRCGLAR